MRLVKPRATRSNCPGPRVPQPVVLRWWPSLLGLSGPSPARSGDGSHGVRRSKVRPRDGTGWKVHTRIPTAYGREQTARAVPARLGSAEKGKPGVTRGRKATGLGLRDRPPPESAGLPDWRLVWLRPARASTRSCASSPLRRSLSRASPRYDRSDANRRVTEPTPRPPDGASSCLRSGGPTAQVGARRTGARRAVGPRGAPLAVDAAGPWPGPPSVVIRSPGERYRSREPPQPRTAAPGAPGHARNRTGWRRTLTE